MRFIGALLFATGTLAATHVRRQAAAPTDLPQAFATIEADTQLLNEATEAFSGDFCPIERATDILLADIRAGITFAESIPSGSLTIDQVLYQSRIEHWKQN